MKVGASKKNDSNLKLGLSRVTSSVMDLSRLFFEDSDLPTVAESEVSYEEEDDYIFQGSPEVTSTVPCVVTSNLPHKLQWEFRGLTIWLELEEFNGDITQAINDMATTFHIEAIPKSHTTAIYGMTHLTEEKAIQKLHLVKDIIGQWPPFCHPTAVVSDIAVAGRPGQVCSIAWCELTLPTNDAHEAAMDKLYSIFYGEDGKEGDTSNIRRQRPWKPHNSIAYDNVEDAMFSLADVIKYAAEHPTLISNGRRVEAMSLWDTNGKMGDWKCLDRVYF